MFKRFENKLTMLKAVLNLLKQNRSLWETSTVMVALFNKLEAFINEIESIRLITDTDLTGITADKLAQQEALIAKIYEFSSILYAMASATENKILQGKVDFSESELQNARGGDLVSTCTSIAALIRENLTALVPYSLTEPDVVVLDEMIASFSENLPTHRVSVSERKAANDRMKDTFTKTDQLMDDQLDRLMVRYKKTSPDLYAAYTNARRIVNYGIRHEKEEKPEGAGNNV
jgi:hypothetical protein